MVRLAWLFAIVIGFASMFSITRFYVIPYNNLESTLYAGFHKLGWNIAIAWLVLAVTTGHAPTLQKILSNRAFAPISRLTYCAYLSNGIVELYYSSSVKTPSYMGYLHLVSLKSYLINSKKYITGLSLKSKRTLKHFPSLRLFFIRSCLFSNFVSISFQFQ